MSLSQDEEDEFQSADEDGFDEDFREDLELTSNKSAVQIGTQTELLKTNSIPAPDSDVIAAASVATTNTEPEVKQSKVKKFERSPSLSDIEKTETEEITTEDQPGEEDEEEALAERIRERNLLIARKFSAELARSVQASAPIPVKSEPPIGFRVDDIEYSDIPDTEKKARQPLAPPPTPALSTSFSAEDPSTSSSPATIKDFSGTTSQYGWRVPIKPRPTPTETSQPQDCDLNQARAALDRLSEKYSDADKSLFQRVADDLKKVSIKSEDPPVAENSPSESSTNQNSSSLPSLSSFGQTFGGWNWNSASRILASASEVTSQVSSVLDSVVNAPRGAPSQQSLGDVANPAASQQTTSSTTDPSHSARKPSMSASEAASNDALVDLTLNAMESLGKKAFGAMTHRDESGSLQIKGLGRPWEQLLNIKKQLSEDDDHRQKGKKQEEDSAQFQSIPTEPFRAQSSDSGKKSSVRRRVVNYDDSDKLD